MRALVVSRPDNRRPVARRMVTTDRGCGYSATRQEHHRRWCRLRLGLRRVPPVGDETFAVAPVLDECRVEPRLPRERGVVADEDLKTAAELFGHRPDQEENIGDGGLVAVAEELRFFVDRGVVEVERAGGVVEQEEGRRGPVPRALKAVHGQIRGEGIADTSARAANAAQSKGLFLEGLNGDGHLAKAQTDLSVVLGVFQR